MDPKNQVTHFGGGCTDNASTNGMFTLARLKTVQFLDVYIGALHACKCSILDASSVHLPLISNL